MDEVEVFEETAPLAIVNVEGVDVLVDQGY